MIAIRKNNYYENECLRLEAPNAHQIAYKALNRIKDEEKPEPWSISMLRPEKNDQEIAEANSLVCTWRIQDGMNERTFAEQLKERARK